MVPLHAYGAAGLRDGGRQLPAPSQVRASVAVVPDVGQVGGGALGARRVQLAVAGAVAEAGLPAGGRARRAGALALRIHAVRRDGLAGARRAAQRARHAGCPCRRSCSRRPGRRTRSGSRPGPRSWRQAAAGRTSRCCRRWASRSPRPRRRSTCRRGVPHLNGKQELCGGVDARAGAVARRRRASACRVRRAAGGAARRALPVELAGAGRALAVRAAGAGLSTHDCGGVGAARRRRSCTMPIVPDSAHDLQALAQAVAQQTPCAQLPEMHSPPAEQKAPFGFLPHELPTHTLPGEQLRVGRAAAEALAAVAGEGDARDRVGRHAAAGRVAGGLGRVLVVLAVLGARRRCRACSAGSRPRRRTCRRCRRSTPPASRTCSAGRRRRSPPAGTCPATTAARSAAGADARLVAADAVDAVVARAVARGGAGLPVRLLAAAAVLAGDARDAVVVAGAAVDAGAVLAPVGCAVLHPGRQAAAETVARPGRVQPVAAARRRRADDLGREAGAAADAVAGTRHPAARGRLDLTDAVRIGTADVDRASRCRPGPAGCS